MTGESSGFFQYAYVLTDKNQNVIYVVTSESENLDEFLDKGTSQVSGTKEMLKNSELQLITIETIKLLEPPLPKTPTQFKVLLRKTQAAFSI